MKKLRIPSIIIVIGCILLVSIAIWNSYEVFTFKDQAKREYERSTQIYVQLLKGQKKFKEENHKLPAEFSEFVQLDGILKAPHTVTLKDYKKHFLYPDTEEDLARSQFTVKYKSGCSVTYLIDSESKEIKKLYSFRPYKCEPPSYMINN